MQIICFWPDGEWCYAEEIEEYLTYKSDDYKSIPMNDCEIAELINCMLPF